MSKKTLQLGKLSRHLTHNLYGARCNRVSLKSPLARLVGRNVVYRILSEIVPKQASADAIVWGSTLIELKLPNGNLILNSLRPLITGHDLLIIGPQNSGGTIAPIIPFAIATNAIKSNLCYKKLYIIVLVPTRDLVLQESRNIQRYIKRMRVSTIYHKELEWYKTNILISTPIGLLKRLESEYISLESVRLLCIHEAQETLSLDFKCGITCIAKIKRLLHPSHQTVYTCRFADGTLKLLAQSLSKLNFRVLNFWESQHRNPIEPIWGPYRSKQFLQNNKSNTSNLNTVNDDFILLNNPIQSKNDKINNTIQQFNPHASDDIKQLVNYYKLIYRERFFQQINCKSIHITSKLYYNLYQPINFFNTLLTACEGNRVICFFPTVNLLQFMNILIKKRLRNVYMLCGSQSINKRRLVIDTFKAKDNGLILTTDIACLGLDLGDFDKVIQVGPCRSFYNFASRANMGKVSISLFHDLDCHFIYLLYKNFGINVEAMTVNCEKNDKNLILDEYMIASMTLAYRSAIGMYCTIAKEFKFEKWQVPSLLNDLFKSIGADFEIKVTKQFAARMGLLNSPGLSVDYTTLGKKTLLATVLGYPGYISRLKQAKDVFYDKDAEIAKEFRLPFVQ